MAGLERSRGLRKEGSEKISGCREGRGWIGKGVKGHAKKLETDAKEKPQKG